MLNQFQKEASTDEVCRTLYASPLFTQLPAQSRHYPHCNPPCYAAVLHLSLKSILQPFPCMAQICTRPGRYGHKISQCFLSHITVHSGVFQCSIIKYHAIHCSVSVTETLKCIAQYFKSPQRLHKCKVWATKQISQYYKTPPY